MRTINEYVTVAVLLTCAATGLPQVSHAVEVSRPDTNAELRWEVVEAWGFGQGQIVLNERISEKKWREEIAWCREFGKGALADFPVGESCDLARYTGDITIQVSQLYAPICSPKTQTFCVESFSAVGKNGKEVTADFIRYTFPERSVPENARLGIPRGESSSVWRLPGIIHEGGSDLYEVSVVLSAHARQLNGKVVSKLDFLNSGEYQFSIRPYASEPASVCGGVWIEQCLSMPDDHVFKLEVNAQRSTRNWFAGRMMDPRVTFAPLGGHGIKVTVQGKPIETAVLQEKINAASASPRLRNLFDFCGMQNVCTGVSVPQSMNGDWKWLEPWKEATKDTLSDTKYSWNMRSMMVDPRKFNYWKFQKCAPENAPAGILTTNALAYDGQMPQLRAGTFTYRVGGLHFKPDGVSRFFGYYEVSMNQDLVTCLLGLPRIPLSAQIGITTFDGEPAVAVKEVGARGSDLRVRTSNFEFSKKVISFKVSAKGYALCTKGNAQKYVRGSKCPDGYR